MADVECSGHGHGRTDDFIPQSEIKYIYIRVVHTRFKEAWTSGTLSQNILCVKFIKSISKLARVLITN